MKEKGGVLAGVLITVAVLIGLAVVAAVGLGVYVATHVHVNQAGGKTDVDTPFGSVHVRENARLDPGRLGIPLYPGARVDDERGKQASVQLELGRHSLSVLAATYTTTDPPDKVADFYRERLPGWSVSESSFTGRDRYKFESRKNGVKRVVAIRERGGVTRIALASVGEPASN